MGTHQQSEWKFRKLKRRIIDLVGWQAYSLWSIDGDPALETLKTQLQGNGQARLTEKEFIALFRAKLLSLFGKPGKAGQEQSSFCYELQADRGKEKVYFYICDRHAEEIAIYWEFSTSEPDVRNEAKKKLFELILAARPADFTDAFSFEDDISVAYGCTNGKPWADIEISMNVQKRMFQSNMKNLQEKHYRIEYSMNRFMEERRKLKVPILRIEY